MFSLSSNPPRPPSLEGEGGPLSRSQAERSQGDGAESWRAHGEVDVGHLTPLVRGESSQLLPRHLDVLHRVHLFCLHCSDVELVTLSEVHHLPGTEEAEGMDGHR